MVCFFQQKVHFQGMFLLNFMMQCNIVNQIHFPQKLKCHSSGKLPKQQKPRWLSIDLWTTLLTKASIGPFTALMYTVCITYVDIPEKTMVYYNILLICSELWF